MGALVGVPVGVPAGAPVRTPMGTPMGTPVGVPARLCWELPSRDFRRRKMRRAAHKSGSNSRAQTVMILAGLLAS
jgi:hypothetical protein